MSSSLHCETPTPAAGYGFHTRQTGFSDRLYCGAGAKLKQVAVEARRHGLSGVEFLEGIPGSVGGALRMNAGAMGGATFEALESIRVMDQLGTISDRAAAEVPAESPFA